MGGATFLLYLLHCRALGKAHHLSRVVLLSPAGFHKHVALFARIGITAVNLALLPAGNGPFPMRSRWVQQVGAKLLQDLKRAPATSDLLHSLFSAFFGGTAATAPFRVMHFTDYPLGGSSLTVLRHGCQCLDAADFFSYDYGRRANLDRYGSERPPRYRDAYSLVDVPVHFIAGEQDALIPAENLLLQHTFINAAAPGLSSVKVFPNSGHLDFTLGMSDDVISHTLEQIMKPVMARGPTGPGAESRDVRADGGGARGDGGDGASGGAASAPPGLSYVRRRARRYPFLFAYTKLEAALQGLEAQMG